MIVYRLSDCQNAGLFSDFDLAELARDLLSPESTVEELEVQSTSAQIEAKAAEQLIRELSAKECELLRRYFWGEFDQSVRARWNASMKHIKLAEALVRPEESAIHSAKNRGSARDAMQHFVNLRAEICIEDRKHPIFMELEKLVGTIGKDV